MIYDNLFFLFVGGVIAGQATILLRRDGYKGTYAAVLALGVLAGASNATLILREAGWN